MKKAEVFSAVAINDFVLKGELGRGIKLSDNYFFTNSHQPASQQIKIISPWLGQADAELFTKKNCIYIYKKFSDEKAEISEQYILDEINQLLFFASSFLIYSWTLKDNSAYLDCGFSLAKFQSTPDFLRSKNYMGTHYSMASGGNEKVEFLEQDIKSLRNFFKLQIEVTEEQGIGENLKKRHQIVSNSKSISNRITRCC